MDIILPSFILIFVAITFAATIVSGFIKLIFFFNQKNTYRQVLKFGLLGEGFGLLIMTLFWTYYRQEISNWAEPEVIVTIPFYLMLIGQLTGLIITLRGRKSINRPGKPTG